MRSTFLTFVLAAALVGVACATSSTEPTAESTSGMGGDSAQAGASASGGNGNSNGGSAGDGGAGGGGGVGAGGDGGSGGTAPPPAELVAWYRFESPTNLLVIDSSLYGHHGTPSAGVTRGVNGPYGLAVLFDGNLANIEVPSTPVLDITGDITIEAWVQLDAPVSYNRMLVRKYLQYQMSISVVPETNLLEFYSQPIGFARATTPVEYAKWIHAAVTHDGTTARLYLNGELTDAVPHAGALPSNNNSLKLGGDGFNQVAPNGGLDEVKIWNVRRTEEQICEDGYGTYNAAASPKCSH